jgi:dipeptidase E
MLKRRILAIGGGGFLMEDGLSPIDDYILKLTGKSNPKICFLPTPAGDRELFLAKFYAAYGQRQCRPSHLTFFSPVSAGAVAIAKIHSQLLDQDAIFVSGGNTKAALAVWREFGVDVALRKAMDAGVVLSGMSAGALCWFEIGHSDSAGELHAIKCLGILPGSCAVHFNGEKKRRPALIKALRHQEINNVLALDDHAAALFENEKLKRIISWKKSSSAYRFSARNGKVKESKIKIDLSLRG